MGGRKRQGSKGAWVQEITAREAIQEINPVDLEQKLSIIETLINIDPTATVIDYLRTVRQRREFLIAIDIKNYFTQ